MLQLIYIVAFIILAVLAFTNLIRNVITFSPGSQREINRQKRYSVPHPELLDNAGNVINEPLMVMKSMSVEEARQKLDSIYKSSPGGTVEE